MTDLVIDAQAAVVLQAAEGLLDLPAPGLDLEPLTATAADQLGRDALGAKESGGIIAGEAAVEPNQEQRGVQLEIRGEGVEGIAVLHIRRDHPQAQGIALDVDHQHPLPAIDGRAVDPVRAAARNRPAKAGR